jgi:signal transduction histidine kinase/CheY-like chemotaxis protein
MEGRFASCGVARKRTPSVGEEIRSLPSPFDVAPGTKHRARLFAYYRRLHRCLTTGGLHATSKRSLSFSSNRVFGAQWMVSAAIRQKRLDLLGQVTMAIGEHQDLDGIFKVVVRNVEEQMPVDFACLCLYNADDKSLTVKRVGEKSQKLALDLAMPERARIDIDENGLSRCVRGHWVYEADIRHAKFPFPQRLHNGGLGCFVATPLQVAGNVFGVLIAARVKVRGFGEAECEFLKQLGEHVALAAHHAQLYGDLQNAYDNLRRTHESAMQQERLRALGQMAGGVAHDINNALSPITLYTELMLKREASLSERDRGFLEIIQRAAGDISHTVTRLGEFSRPSVVETPPALVDLNVLIPDVLDLTRARWSDMAQQRGVVIETRMELHFGLPAVLGVASEIRTALTNLIFNAVDAMPSGGTLTLKTRLGPDRRVFLEVVDTGVGMDDESRRRCLEPFFTTKHERGSGLGLAMVYGIAKRHHATVEIDSALGDGTTMKLNFPQAPEGVNLQPTSVIQETSPPYSPLRLLLVDDDLVLRTSLTDILQADGHALTSVGDGPSGVAAFKAAIAEGRAFDAVITDLGMPVMNGRMVAAAVKDCSASTPVILLTGWGRNFLNDLPDHVDCVLTKPPTMRDVRAALMRCCGDLNDVTGEAA